MRSPTQRGASLAEIEALYRRRLPELRRVAAAIVGDRERALDAVQEAFAAAVRRRASFRGDGPLEAWVWRIVVNHARSELRARPLRAPAAGEGATNGDVPDADARLAAALARLTDRQRLVLFLRHYADLDYATIAETLDISAGTVAATLNAAHTALRRRLQEVPR
jgi:RNA polymerase sigma-70 factor (ECF subfamily)